jgi:tetratricopeptide (TPR) repeat protein
MNKEKSMRRGSSLCALVLLGIGHSIAFAAQDLEREIATFIHDYDAARFDAPNDDARSKAFSALIQRASALAKQNPTRGEPLVWKGIVEAEQSAFERSLGQVKQARKTLEAAVAMLPNAYAADAHASLGSMYANVPGFPLGFGDKKQARLHFQKALALAPTHVSGNLNYGNLLLKDEDYAGAMKHANAALAGLPRAGRERADKASRATADNILAKAKEKLRQRARVEAGRG